MTKQLHLFLATFLLGLIFTLTAFKYSAYKKEYFDRKIMNEMGELGFLGCTINDYGLPGISSVA
jgi:hypothetical protein